MSRLPDLYPLGEVVFEAGFRLLDIRLRSFGHEHIPASGPAVLASNHIGYLDFCFVMLAMPRPRRRVRFVARREVFAHPLAGPLMRGLRQIEADPYGDANAAVRSGVDVLRAGGVVGIHPEGTISPSFVPRPGRTGAVRMAQVTGAPLIPVGVWGSHRLLTKWRPRSLRRGIPVDVHYGPPVGTEGDPVEVTGRLLAAIADLVAAAQEDYPETPAAGDDWWLPAHLGGGALTPEEAEEHLARQHAERVRARRSGDDPDAAGGPGQRDPT